MAIKKRSINSQGRYTDYKHLKNNYNESSLNNYSHKSNIPTNFNLTEITLSDIDTAVFQEFDKRFKIATKDVGLLILDAEIPSLHNQNYQQFDKDKGYLNLPFFTMLRTKATPIRKTNPSYKPAVYVVPISKPNGIVYEEYITEGPIEYELIYDFKFITNFREYTNEMEQQMGHYFRNKRNMIICNNERFVISPLNQGTLGELEIINRESVEERSLYMMTYTLKLWCWTRSLANMQKRERPNTLLLDMNIRDSKNKMSTSEVINIERFEVDMEKYPQHPVPDNKFK